jgi:hypothetical protein
MPPGPERACRINGPSERQFCAHTLPFLNISPTESITSYFSPTAPRPNTPYPADVSTLRQRESARINGALSQGPLTPERKAVSSRNATRHGILANTLILPGESEERFQELLSGLTEQFQPRNTAERACVEKMAAAFWRQLRMWALEKTEFAMEMARVQDRVKPYASQATVAFRHLSDNSRSLDLMSRYETALDRHFIRAVALFRTLRAMHPARSTKFPNEPDSREHPDPTTSYGPPNPAPRPSSAHPPADMLAVKHIHEEHS